MKNKHIQAKRARAKEFLRKTNKPWKAKGGVQIYHCYDNPRDLTYWDDFSFVLGSQRVIVTWLHPRMELADGIEEMAFKIATQELGSPGLSLDKANPVFKKVGRSRKKAIAYRAAAATPSFEAWYQRVQQAKKILLKEDTLEILPSIHIEQWEGGRHVALTYPVELRNEADIFAFAAKLKAHLKGESNLFEGLEDYRYTTADYRREHPKEFEQP